MEFLQRRRTPSFSSSLLDAIYRSIDESNGLGPSKTNNTVPSPINKNHNNNNRPTSLRRVIMNDDDNWLAQRRSRSYAGRTHHSASSSSDSSSSAATFSSSEAESFDKDRRSARKSDHQKLAVQGKRLDLGCEKPEKTQKTLEDEIKLSKIDSSKLQAMKMYEELKKSKQPFSPGARLTSLLNSIFQSNAKKVKICSVGATKDVSFDRKSKTSSSSSSCFSKSRRNSENNNSSNNNNNNNNNKNGMKRSVRFYPVSAIVDEDSRSCGGHKDVQQAKDLDSIPGFSRKKKVGKRTSSLKDELKIHDKKMTCNTSKFDLKHSVGSYDNDNVNGYEDEEEDDVWSYSSSDLFELDHRIGMACRYSEELPVYETTNLKTNQAIARGLIL